MRTVIIFIGIALIPLAAAAAEHDTGAIDQQIRAEEKAIEDISLQYQSVLRHKTKIEEQIREEDISLSDLDEELLEQEYAAVARRKTDIDERIREKDFLTVQGRVSAAAPDVQGPGTAESVENGVQSEKEKALRYVAEIDALIQKQKMLLEQGLWLEAEMRKNDKMIRMGKGLPE